MGAQIIQLVGMFFQGLVDIKWSNYEVLTLLPKVIGAEFICQFRLTALINVIFKLVDKVFPVQLSSVAHRVIHPNQSAFI